MDFGNTFGEFEEISVDVTDYLKQLKTTFYILGGVFIVVCAVILKDIYKSGITDSNPFVLPVAVVMLGVVGLSYALKYISALNSFPGNNPLVFSLAGLRAPMFVVKPYTIFKQAENLRPVTLSWSEIKKIEVVNLGKAGPMMRITFNSERRPILLPKKLFHFKLGQIENFLNQNYPGKYGGDQTILSKSQTLPGYAVAIVIIAIAGIGIYSGFKDHTSQLKQTPRRTVNDDRPRQSFTRDEINEAMLWATPSNPAALSNRMPESYKNEKWPNGALKSKEPVVDGKIEGIGRYWFDNGQLYGEIPYLNGQKHGRFTLYRPDGNFDQELVYKNGKMHGLSRWSEPKLTWLYIEGNPVNEIRK